MKKYYSIIIVSFFCCSAISQQDTSILKALRELAPKTWIVQQTGNEYTFIKPDSIWTKGFPGGVFRTKNYVDPCDSIKDYETEMCCRRSHDGSYSKIKYRFGLRLDPKWSKEKTESVNAYNDSLINQFYVLVKKYPTHTNGKSYTLWDRYWVQHDSDITGEKRAQFEKEKELIKSQIIKQTPYSTKWFTVFFDNNRDMNWPCEEKERKVIYNFENSVYDLMKRDTFDLGGIRYRSRHTKKEIKLTLDNYLRVNAGSKKSYAKEVYLKIKRGQPHTGMVTIIYHVDSKGAIGKEYVNVVELPDLYPKKTIAVKWRIVSE